MGKIAKQLVDNEKISQYILLGLTLIGGFLAVLYWQKDTLAVYDASGHLASVESARKLWPAASFWNGRELLGWPQGIFYPPLFYWLAATLSFLVGTANAVKILISATFLVLPLSIFVFGRKFIPNQVWVSVTTLITFALITFSPDFLGSNVRGLFHIGLVPNFFVLPLIFLFLASVSQLSFRKSLFAGLLLAILITTHIVAGIIGIFYLAALFFSKVLFGEKSSLRFFLLALVVAAFASAFFWIPFLANHGYTSVATHGVVTSYLVPNIVVAAASLALLIYSFGAKKENIFVLSLVSGAICTTALVDSVLFKRFGTSFFLETLNIYRFQIFAYLFFACSLISVLAKQKWVERYKRFSNLASILIFVLIVVGLVVKNPAVYQEAKVSLEDQRKISGRFLENFRRAESFPATYRSQTLLESENPKADWAFGVFTESSTSAPFIQSLIKSLRPAAYPEGEGVALETKFVDPKKIPQLLNLFGISHLINLEDAKKDAVGTWVRNGETKYYNLEKVSETPLFEVIELPLEPVGNDWNKKVENWWLEEGPLTKLPYLVKGEELAAVSAREVEEAQVKVLFANEKQTQFELNIISEKKVPVLAKISYFPYWKAFQEGKEIPIYRVAPNLMLLEANGKVTLEYKEPAWVKGLYLVSAGTLVIVIFLIFSKRQKSRSN